MCAELDDTTNQDVNPSPSNADQTLAGWPTHPDIPSYESRNLWLIAVHQMALRTGWMFKTESIIIPAFLDIVAGPGAGWLRGFLPILSRIGQSVPPVFFADLIKTTRQKKWAHSAFTILMGTSFAILSVVWLFFGGQILSWMPAIFLSIYFLFFVSTGLYNLSFGTLQGKLIRPTKRGRLIWTATFFGSIPAMSFAFWLMPAWIENPSTGYGHIFAFVAICFILSGLIITWVHEPQDPVVHGKKRNNGHIEETWMALRKDGNLRRLVATTMLASSVIVVLPHYQALARDRLGLIGFNLVIWAIVQNGSVGVYSLFVGPVSDKRGNRLTLRLLLFASAIPPILAASLPYLPGNLGRHMFWIVFVFLGITPMLIRTTLNYTLEICAPSQHARYISTLNLCASLPFFLSPLVGWAVDAIGFEIVFVSASIMTLLSGMITFTLAEPRHHTAAETIEYVKISEGE